jgi:hypothetical protein
MVKQGSGVEMARRQLIGMCVGAAALLVACDNRAASPVSPGGVAGIDAAADGSTLKIAAPTLVSPINGVQLQGGSSVVLTLTNVSGKFASFPVTFDVEITNAGGTIVANPKFSRGSGTSTAFTLTTTLLPSTVYSWRARGTYSGGVGPWSGASTFRTGQSAFISGSTVVDPLTTGATVGRQRGGHFITGQGWQADSVTDGIDYDITTCSNCRLEFDLTNVGNGLGNPTDLKWITMGDGRTFDDFLVFRDHPWKMHLEQRADGDGTGMKLIFRNGSAGTGNPGDHEGRNDSTVNWQRSQVYRFVLDWTPNSYFFSVNGQVWFSGAFSGQAYSPPSHRISLGCYPRQETWVGAIFRNVTVTPR